jgi:hypothetical protein
MHILAIVLCIICFFIWRSECKKQKKEEEIRQRNWEVSKKSARRVRREYLDALASGDARRVGIARSRYSSSGNGSEIDDEEIWCARKAYQSLDTYRDEMELG